MTCDRAASTPARARDIRRIRRGFTLAEIVVALGVMAILAAIALPHLDRTAVNVDLQEQSVRGALIMAQRLAVTRGYDVVVSFDTVMPALRVQEDPDGDGAFDTGERVQYTRLDGDVRFGRGAAPALNGAAADIGFTAQQSGRPAFAFHRDGSTSERAVFYLSSRRGTSSDFARDARAFDLQRATGRLIAYRYTGSAWRKEVR